MTEPTPKPTFEDLAKELESAAASYDYAQHQPKWDVEVINNRFRDLEAARQALLAAHAEMREVCSESNAVCLCGCPTSEHENYGEDGESCENGDHRCIRTSKAVFIEVQALKSELKEAKAEIERVSADGKMNLAFVFSLTKERDELKAELEKAQAELAEARAHERRHGGCTTCRQIGSDYLALGKTCDKLEEANDKLEVELKEAKAAIDRWQRKDEIIRRSASEMADVYAECFDLRKERDELKAAIRNGPHEDANLE